MIRTLLVAAVALLALAGPAQAEPRPDVVYPNDPQLQRAYESGFRDGAVRGEDQGYSAGRDDGYDDGYAAGLSEGEQTGRDEAERESDQDDLRNDVESEAQRTEEPEVVEGGQDLGTSPGVQQPEEKDGPGVPWWPLAFAVAATAWFVMRRRRVDEETDD